ncbi:MAG: apolipoprotein N-acyltransferase [Verrucomicrobiota bacterium]
MALTKFWLNSSPAVRFFAAVLGGVLLSASFAPLGMAWAAWIAPGVILFSSFGGKSARAFGMGFVAGLVHFLSSLYWLLNMPFAWHGIPIAPAAGWLALSAYCALYPAIWVWLCWKFFPGPCATADQFAATGCLRRLAWAFVAGAFWTALEFGRGTIMTGFPWNFVGASQYKLLPLIQIAAMTGIYGVSFLVVWTSVSLYAAALTLARRPAAQSFWTGAGLPLLVVAGVVSFGACKVGSIPTPQRELKVALIQPDIPQTLIWDPAGDKARFQTVLDLSEKALASNPRLVLWPESAVPDLNPEVQQAIAQLVRRSQTWLVFCAGTSEPASDATTSYFNSALLCNPDGGLESIYHKRRLVIFGEYIPLVRWLPFLKWLTPIGGEITPGDHVVNFEIKNPSAKISVLICFEDMFAQEARQHVGPDTDFLVNLTDDGWFGHAAEQWQQAASAIFRAVENGVPLLRCTNDGLTCWADSQGRVRQIQNDSGNVYGPGYIIAQIPLRAVDDHRRTFYNRHGDWFPFSCGTICIGWLIATVWSRRHGMLPNGAAETVRN